MGKGRKLRWNILVVLAAAAFLLFLGFIVLMVWGVRWMGGQKDFRRELADSIGDSVLEGVTATGPTLRQALADAYAAAETVDFDGKYLRHDIGQRALAALAD